MDIWNVWTMTVPNYHLVRWISPLNTSKEHLAISCNFFSMLRWVTYPYPDCSLVLHVAIIAVYHHGIYSVYILYRYIKCICLMLTTIPNHLHLFLMILDLVIPFGKTNLKVVSEKKFHDKHLLQYIDIFIICIHFEYPFLKNLSYNKLHSFYTPKICLLGINRCWNKILVFPMWSSFCC